VRQDYGEGPQRPTSWFDAEICGSERIHHVTASRKRSVRFARVVAQTVDWHFVSYSPANVGPSGFSSARPIHVAKIKVRRLGSWDRLSARIPIVVVAGWATAE